MHLEYVQDGLDQALIHTTEECSEVIMAITKIQRFGLYSYNPNLPPELRKTNKEDLLNELDDMKHAIERLEIELSKQ